MSELEEVKEELRSLKVTLEEKTQEKSPMKLLGFISPLIYLITLLISMGIAWGIFSSRISSAKDLSQIVAEKTVQLEEKLNILNTKQAVDDQVLKTILIDIAEIKKDVKYLRHSKEQGN